VLVLVPCQATVCKFPGDLMNNIMMGLFPSVIDVLKDCNKARLAVTTYFNGAAGYIVECGNGFCDNNNCKDAAVGGPKNGSSKLAQRAAR
jgi:hypothetical protein